MVEVAQPASHTSTTIPTIIIRAWTFALFGKSCAIAKWVPPSQKESQMQATRDACNSLADATPLALYERNGRFSARNAVSIHVLLSDRHFAAYAEGAAGDF